ncbi:hypothetical protein [Methylomonas fluvii]|nr:hypothetical protein [Methylomonas fluvii]
MKDVGALVTDSLVPGNIPAKPPHGGLGGHAVAGAMIYITGQAFNLLFQLLLLRALGTQTYGHVGLAHISLTALLFVGDLGYSLYFLREKPNTAHWRKAWRAALGHRLLVSLLAFAALAAFWITRFGSVDPGWIYLLAAAPAVLAALVNFSSPLLAGGRHGIGFAMQQIAWPAAAISLVLAWPLREKILPPAALAGGCVSIGYLIQASFNLAAMRRFCRVSETGAHFGALLIPGFSRSGWRMLKASLTLSTLGFLGVANDRLTAFLIEDVAAGFLPAYLLLGQILAGASGMLGQLNRLLVAGESRGYSSASPVRVMAALLLAPMSLLLLVIAPTCNGGCWQVPTAWLQLGLPVLLDWTLSALGGSMAAVLIGRHQEKKLALTVLFAIAFSIATQLAGAQQGSADAVLWARVAGASLGFAATARLSGLAVPVSLLLFGLAVALSSMSQARLLPWPVPAAASLIMLSAVLSRDTTLIRQAFCAARYGRNASTEENAAGLTAISDSLALQTGTLGETAEPEDDQAETKT